jgi:hypothetical protein
MVWKGKASAIDDLVIDDLSTIFDDLAVDSSDTSKIATS